MPLLTGNTEVTVCPSGSPYNFQYYSSVGGAVCGSITFTDAETGEEETLCGWCSATLQLLTFSSLSFFLLILHPSHRPSRPFSLPLPLPLPSPGSVMWYTIEIEVISPEAESFIDVSSEVRKAVVVEITLGQYAQRTYSIPEYSRHFPLFNGCDLL
jgi:hypothetical protein